MDTHKGFEQKPDFDRLMTVEQFFTGWSCERCGWTPPDDDSVFYIAFEDGQDAAKGGFSCELHCQGCGYVEAYTALFQVAN
jgi:predicted nucleic-acid-binding Zn-ribbon protein